MSYLIDTLLYAGAFIALLFVLVVIHECGHYFVARFFGVHCPRFSFGMGPVIYKKVDKHGTEFALSAFPLGGYVSMITKKMFEVEPDLKKEFTEEQLTKTFDTKPKLQRAAIMLAGPFANFILAIFIFSFIFSTTLDPQSTLVVNDVKGSNFFTIGDQVISIDEKKIADRKDISLELLSKAGMSGELMVETLSTETGLKKTISIPVKNFLSDSSQQENPIGALGISLESRQLPIIGNIMKDGSAELAGLKKKDKIIGINNSKIFYAADIPITLNSLDTNFADIHIIRGDDSMIIPVELTSALDTQGNPIRLLGIQFGLKRSFFSSIIKGTSETYNLSIKTIQFIGKMLSGNMGTDNLSGPIGIAKMAGETAQAGFLPFMYLMALLSISLGVLNLLPIPALDGGQLTLLGVEAIRGSPLPDKIENFVYATGTVMIISLMIFAVFNDVSRF
ncbi:MAG: RIP metalloprotease RseP [SAR86 cluster bacterium]|uniref:Zinc metalloprotease n=1 Tax=SAR86 cluster bacterium TaxID=2030880 RepID=A0A520MAV7_9GAMM|nr:MAG: RIP metalloprotease RseP [SAR86 cluster bacterium]